MILIVTENVAQSIIRHRGTVRGLSRCRRRGHTAMGEPVLLCPRHMLRIALCGEGNVREIIWDGFTPTQEEENYGKARTL